MVRREYMEEGSENREIVAGNRGAGDIGTTRVEFDCDQRWVTIGVIQRLTEGLDGIKGGSKLWRC